jgi:Na+-translocating ferredoxin:NAD+ oxidoreductase subunit C
MKKQQWLRPSKVSIPLHNPSTKYYDLTVAAGDEVLIGQQIATRYNQDVRLPVFSSVSGVVKEVKSLEYINGISMDHLVIENNKADQSVSPKPLLKPFTTQILRSHFTNMGIQGLDQSGLYTAVDFSQNIKQVIVNAVYENAPFVDDKVAWFEDQTKAIVEGCLLLSQAALAPVTVLADRRELATALQQAGVAFKMVRPKAHKAWQVEAIQQIMKQRPPFDLLEVGVMYTNAHTVKAIYDAVERGVPVTTTEVVVLPDDSSSQRLVEVKIGSNVNELMESLSITPPQGDHAWFNGSVLSGGAMKSDAFVVHADASTIGVTSSILEEDVCIKCGLCNDVCPVGILPQNIMDAEIRVAEDRIYDYRVDQCVECGLCSYVCPSEINVLEWVRRAKRRVARGVE